MDDVVAYTDWPWRPIQEIQGLYKGTVKEHLHEDAKKESLLLWKDQPTFLDSCQSRKVIHYGAGRASFANDVCLRTPPFAQHYSNAILPVPPWIMNIMRALEQQKIVTAPLNQANLIFYKPGAGILPHFDSLESYGGEIVMISLTGSVTMEFHNFELKEKSRIFLPASSLIVCRGDSRYSWMHSITSTTEDYDEKNKVWVPRAGVRISLILRNCDIFNGYDGAIWGFCRMCRQNFVVKVNRYFPVEFERYKFFCQLCEPTLKSKRQRKWQAPRPGYERPFLPTKAQKKQAFKMSIRYSYLRTCCSAWLLKRLKLL